MLNDGKKTDPRRCLGVATYGFGFDVEEIVEALGGYVVTVDTPEEADKVGHNFDLLLLQGGTDINPILYGQKDGGKCQIPNTLRDNTELTLLSHAFSRHIPVLGICRGHQMLTVALGGTLYQDISGHCGMGTHNIKSFGEVPTPSLQVNSLHHQAVATTGKWLEVKARSSDGVIESVFSKEIKALGVQFHPEMMVDTDERWMSIFRWWYNGFDGLAPAEPLNRYVKYSKYRRYGWGYEDYDLGYGDFEGYDPNDQSLVVSRKKFKTYSYSGGKLIEDADGPFQRFSSGNSQDHFHEEDIEDAGESTQMALLPQVAGSPVA
jgi:putative glutamine amidotransferase